MSGTTHWVLNQSVDSEQELVLPLCFAPLSLLVELMPPHLLRRRSTKFYLYLTTPVVNIACALDRARI